MADIRRILTTLNNSGIQTRDPPVYQAFKDLVDILSPVGTSGAFAELDKNNVFTAPNQTITSGDSFPSLILIDENAVPDSRAWAITSGSDKYLRFKKLDDAGTVTAEPFAFGRVNNDFWTGMIELYGGQIHFPATQTASSDVNTLDDYEEGTWTPVINATGGGTRTYSSQSASYVKVGQFCHCAGRLIGTTSTQTGTLSLSGLPFNCEGNHNVFHGIGYGGIAVNAVWIGGYVIAATNGIQLNIKTAASTTWSTAMIHTDLGAVFDFLFAFSYRTNA